MRTENDLIEAIELLAGRDAEAVALLDRLTVAPTRDQRTPRRVLMPLLAVLLVVAVAVTSLAVFGSRRHDSGNDVGGAPYTPLQWKFSVGKVPGYTITRDGISRFSYPTADIGEIATVTATGKGKTTGVITFDTVPGKLIRTSDSSTIAGVTYYFHPGRHVTRQGGLTPAQYANPWVAVSQDANGPQLSWSYPDGSQFHVDGSFGFNPKTYNYNNGVARRTLLQIAAAIRHGRQDPVTMPFGMPSLPNRLVPVGLSITPPERVGSEGTLGNPTPLSACLQYATTDQPSPPDPTESIALVCRVKVGTSQREALASVSFTAGFITRYKVRRLHDGSLLAVGVATGAPRNQQLSETQLERVIREANVNPKLADTSRWIEVP